MDLKSVMIVISGLTAIASLLYTWRREHSKRVRDLATKYRQQLADALQKIVRIQQLNLTPYFDMHPIFVDIDSKFSDALEAHDLVWREFYTLYIDCQRRILDDSLETCYIPLYSTMPKLSQLFRSRVSILNNLKENVFHLCNVVWQAHLLRWSGRETYAESAEIGNLLRRHFNTYATILKNSSDLIISDLSGHCDEMCSVSDKAFVMGDFELTEKQNLTADELIMWSTVRHSSSDLIKEDLRAAIDSLEAASTIRSCHVHTKRILKWHTDFYRKAYSEIPKSRLTYNKD